MMICKDSPEAIALKPSNGTMMARIGRSAESRSSTTASEEKA